MITSYKIYLVSVLVLLLSLHAIADPLVEPDIFVSQTELSWDHYYIGDIIMKRISIENKGRGPLNITRVDITGDVTDFSKSSAWETQTVESDGFIYLDVYFNPTSAGTKNATVRIYSNDPDENPLLISCTGIAMLYPKLLISPTTLDFGVTTNKLTFLISNAGEGGLVWEVAENPDKLWITSVTPESGYNNATITVTVDRNQLTSANDTGILTVKTNVGTQEVNVNIAKIEPNYVNNYKQGNPNEYRLDQNYPNPFNPVTNIRFTLPKPDRVNISICTLNGVTVSTLIDNYFESGIHSVIWNASNIPSGVYFIKMQSVKFVQSNKCILLK
jgi:hypothetical protein